MDMWLNVVIGLHVLIALVIIGLVLIQHGKGADMGSGFGSGASGSLFGATGSANFLSRATAVLATLFFLTSLGLAYLATHKPKSGGGVLDAVRTLPPGTDAAKSADKAGDRPPADAPGVVPKGPAEAPPASSKPKDVPQ